MLSNTWDGTKSTSSKIIPYYTICQNTAIFISYIATIHKKNNNTLATCNYGTEFSAIVAKDNFIELLISSRAF
ncbi:hypothetical protein CAXC1_200008 [Candidatus Xenohaliotis californiensis]|uniref:Uncharacterized protein n=1 Tax=Candidatus Xenohaliotis californiensis TaxID=84677 RepID=A0ABM9N7N2_9RICK|nr:hypothetical protein CAXC1_200008 [Candidatus Xenohaliotis californiensis]